MLEELIRKYKKKLVKIALGWTLTSVMVVVFITFMILMIEYAIPSNDVNLVIQLGMIYFFVNILRSLATFFEDLNHEATAKEIEADYREELYQQIQDSKQCEIDKLKVGEMLETMMNDTKTFANYFGTGVCRSCFGGIVRLLGTLGVLLYLNIPIVSAAFFIYLLGFGITFLANKKSMRYTKLKREANAKILNWSNEQVQGVSTIKSLQIEEQRMKGLKYLVKEYEKITNQLEKNIRSYTTGYTLVISFVGVVNILIGSMSVAQGLLSYGALVILAKHISTPELYAKWFIDGFQIRNIGKISYQRIKAIMEKEKEDIQKGEILETVDSIAFENVSFSYQTSQRVLNEVSLMAKKNEKIALIGRTGSGKTSLVNLLCRFYDATEGHILINGKDYTKYSIQSLRKQIGYIMQKVVIFEGTILENINYASRSISQEKIEEICKKLNLHDKIRSLPNGYETRISEDMDLFSTGEKQLLNFARVMVEDPQIIILDEATASLSYKSEMLVRKAIGEITKNKISFIVAHRLSTIENCDTILLMQDGRIVEQGTHKQLLQQKGEYYHLLDPAKRA